MARYTNQVAASKIGNHFDMVLIEATRTRELRRGKRSLIDSDEKPAIVAIQEIEQGLIGREYLRKLRPWQQKQKSQSIRDKK
jgi:DNA-directed RNA polymerase omega subunit